MAIEKKIVTEASTLGFAPGCWPLRVTVEGRVFWRAFVNTARDGDVLSGHYRCQDNGLLVVLND